MQEQNIPPVPTPEEMLERLNSIDLEGLNIKKVTEELKGKKNWLFVLVIPISAILLVLLTLLGTFLTDYFIASFLLAAFFLYLGGRFLDQYDQQYRIAARKEVHRRIQEAEGEFGLLPHFRDFLPKKYRHLWQSLRKGRYHYVDQYIAAIHLLQQKLDPNKFTRIWYLKYPEIAPEDFFDEDED